MAKGNREDAIRLVSEMESEFEDSWIMYLGIGDIYARIGEYEKAKYYYRQYTLHQSPPRYTDSLTSIAQICEMQGDYSGAIDAIREEIRLLAEDWNTTTGETVDQHLRKIELLERKLMSKEGRGA